jgi:spore maturation protein CgeB
VISLNFSGGARIWKRCRQQIDNQVKARIFEVPGAGGFLLSEQAPGLERSYQPGREIVIFSNDKELPDLLSYYLAHPSERDQIAQAGYQRTCAEHLYELRFANLIKFAIASRDRYFSQSAIHPTGQIDWGAFSHAARFHKLSPQLRALRRLLSALGIAIWGPVRGPRAARRLVFELSWRLRGRQTYSSAGLPGRMFYLES